MPAEFRIGSISLLITGNEILDGRTLERNSAHLIERLHREGYSIANVLICSDAESDMRRALVHLSGTADAIITSGGLGPTEDDRTRKVIAQLLELPLEESAQARKEISDWLALRGRSLEGPNVRQAWVPRGSSILSNRFGTAPGFVVQGSFAGKALIIAALPGPPNELEPMVEEELLPLLAAMRKDLPKLHSLCLRIFNLPESEAAKRIESLKLEEKIEITYRVCFPEIEIGIIAPDSASANDAVAEIIAAIGPEKITSRKRGCGLVELVHELLVHHSLTLSLAESCTGGLLGSMLTSAAGSSAYFLGSAVTYSNAAKEKLLHVSPLTIERHGSVSAEVAKEMAAGAREIYGSDLAVSITGIAGPQGGSAEKPVGLFYLGLAAPEKVEPVKELYLSTRERIRRFASYRALDLIRGYIESN